LDTPHAVDVYSRYLHSQFTSSSLDGPSDDRTDRIRRYEALQAASSNGLDMSSIAKRVTEVTVEDISIELPDFDAAKASFGLDALVASSQASEKEVDLIRSVEWLTFDSSTYPEALVHANALIRYFLCEPDSSASLRQL
jgi:nuclear pore complex protein Nup107